MLDAHRQLIVAYDTLFIPKAVPRLKPGKNPKLTPEIVEKLRTVGYTTATRDRPTGGQGGSHCLLIGTDEREHHGGGMGLAAILVTQIRRMSATRGGTWTGAEPGQLVADS